MAKNPATRASKSPTTQRKYLLKLHRLHEGLYARIARRTGVDASYVSRVARGERHSPKISTALLADLASIEKQREQIAR
jgi:transcriptional regulator with XRE-family HTH domain